MNKLPVSSQITFLYFERFEESLNFFKDVLKLEIAYNPGWACVFRTGKKSFIGAVDVSKGSIDVDVRGGVLISLTVQGIEEVYERLKEFKLDSMSQIKAIESIGLKSFFFKGPEGYDFEIQEFVEDELRDIF